MLVLPGEGPGTSLEFSISETVDVKILVQCSAARCVFDAVRVKGAGFLPELAWGRKQGPRPVPNRSRRSLRRWERCARGGVRSCLPGCVDSVVRMATFQLEITRNCYRRMVLGCCSLLSRRPCLHNLIVLGHKFEHRC